MGTYRHFIPLFTGKWNSSHIHVIVEGESSLIFSVSVRVDRCQWEDPHRKYGPELNNSRWVKELGLETMQPGPMPEITLQNWAGEDPTGTIEPLSHCNWCLQFHQWWSLNAVLGDSPPLTSCISACLASRSIDRLCSKLSFKNICRAEALGGRDCISL